MQKSRILVNACFLHTVLNLNKYLFGTLSFCMVRLFPRVHSSLTDLRNPRAGTWSCKGSYKPWSASTKRYNNGAKRRCSYRVLPAPWRRRGNGGYKACLYSSLVNIDCVIRSRKALRYNPKHLTVSHYTTLFSSLKGIFYIWFFSSFFETEFNDKMNIKWWVIWYKNITPAF